MLRRKHGNFLFFFSCDLSTPFTDLNTRLSKRKKREFAINHICTCADWVGEFIQFLTDSSTYLNWAGNFTFHPSNLLRPQNSHLVARAVAARPRSRAADVPSKPQQGLLKPAPKSANAGLFLSLKGWHMLRSINSSLHLSRYIPGGKYRTCNHSWRMWQWATEAENERSN